MLAEACATGKPVAIFPLPVRSVGISAWVRFLGRTLGDAVASCAYARPLNRRGIERPQKGVQRFCAGLLAKGRVRTGGHSRQLHESLISHGLAVYFDGSLPPPPKSSVNEVNRVADRVRTMMGLEKSKEAIVTGDEPRVAVLEQRS
jgi:mitochondrial fission protein ELM1